MKSFKLFFLLAGLFAAAAHAQTGSDFAPSNLSSVIFNGTIAAGTGGANTGGTFSTLFASNGFDYTLNPDGTLTDPLAFTYTKTGANTARVTEAAMGTNPAVTVDMAFTSATGGTFVATYANGATQRGDFTLAPVAFSAPLANVSTRTTLPPNGTAITGFVISGGGPRRVLIRAVGPALSAFGVGSPLTNPSIMLWRGSTQIGGNDDYASGANVDSTLPATFTQVGAFSLPANSRDAAMVTTLEPGAYTAQIRGSTATETGEVLLEVYFLN